MPTGSWLSETFSAVSPSGGTSTGTGAPSNPRWALGGSSPTGSTEMTNAGPRYNPTAGGSGYTTQTSGTPSGANQFPLGQGPSAYMPGSIAQYPDAIYNPNMNPLSSAQMLATSLYGPQQQLLNDQLARQQSQLGMIGIDADYKTDALNRDTALNKQLLGLDRDALGLDRNLTNTQLANLDRLRAILGKQYGLAGEQLANQLAGYKVDEDKARDMASRQQWDLRSALTARGAFNTVANERGTGRINRDLTYALRQIDVGRKGADIGYRGNVLGLDEKGIGYDNQEASLGARLSNIGIDLSRIGIKEQQLDNALQDGLHQIGLDSMISINGLLDAMGSTNAQQSQLAGTILGEVLKYSTLPPDVLQQIMTAMGTTTTTTSPTTPAQQGVPR